VPPTPRAARVIVRKGCARVTAREVCVDDLGIPLAPCEHMLQVCALAIVVSACSGHTLMHDTVVMKISPTEAQVCLHPGTFVVGDRVTVFKTTCQMGLDHLMACHRDNVGRGRITRVINEHYATIELTARSLEEGFGVEVVR
jgi:hypothetical protein